MDTGAEVAKKFYKELTDIQVSHYTLCILLADAHIPSDSITCTAGGPFKVMG